MTDNKEPSRASVIAGNIFLVLLVIGFLAIANCSNKHGLTGRPDTLWKPDY